MLFATVCPRRYSLPWRQWQRQGQRGEVVRVGPDRQGQARREERDEVHPERPHASVGGGERRLASEGKPGPEGVGPCNGPPASVPSATSSMQCMGSKGHRQQPRAEGEGLQLPNLTPPPPSHTHFWRAHDVLATRSTERGKGHPEPCYVPLSAKRPCKWTSWGPKAAVGEGSPIAGGVSIWTHLANSEGSCPPLYPTQSIETGTVRGLPWHSFPRERKGEWRGKDRPGREREGTRR